MKIEHIEPRERDDDYFEAKAISFWVFTCDVIMRLSLLPGASIEITYGGEHEEGHSYYTDTYTRIGDTIHLEWSNSCLDCDGPLDLWGSNVMETPGTGADDLATWKMGTSAQRDVYAEQMGY